MYTAEATALNHDSNIAKLTPIHADYALLPIEQGFNWQEVFANVAPGEWYLVVFRSRHRLDSDKDLLTQRDEWAYQSAAKSAGFVYYFRGIPNTLGDCLSFCLWKTREDAVVAARTSEHQSAQELASKNYLYFRLERYQVIKAHTTVEFQPLS